ncbi:MAG: hydrogen peroxide-inducible genes activator [Flavobacteriales bacterium]|nr:hydrogen peroxide-inducible genes activator [Flavobacteriales bacterium]
MTSLIQLEYIVAVDTYRHFVTAAEKCFVTQPTLSMQIKKMEDDLGIVIFDRTKQPIIPTEIGIKIIEQARTTISEAKKINEIINDYSNSITGEISIGIIPSLAPYLLPLFIGKFTKKYPDVSVKVVELLTDEIISQLKKDTLDVGILVTPLQEKGIIEEVLFYEEMKIISNKSHAFATKNNIKTEDLTSDGLWLLNNGHCFRSQVVNLCSYKTGVGKKPLFDYESGSLETIKKLVEIEGGYALFPELAVDTKSSNTITKQINKTPLREVSFAYTRNYSKKRLLNILSQDIKNAVPKYMLSKERGFVVEWR